MKDNNFMGLDFFGLDRALDEKCTIRIFSSGSGLRIVKVEKTFNLEVKLKAYGENRNLIPALFVANEDFLKGGSKYSCIYYSGSSEHDSQIDWWISCHGENVTITKNEKGIVQAATNCYCGVGKTVNAALRDLNNWMSKQNKKELIYKTFSLAD